jgi:phage terminase small subunit
MQSPQVIDQQLTTKQRALVDALVAEDITITEASQRAGYAKGESGRVVASKTLRLAHVEMYLFQQVAKHIGMTSVKASHTLTRLLGARSEYVQLEAAKDILDRGGFRPPERKDVRVSGDFKVTIDLSGKPQG